MQATAKFNIVKDFTEKDTQNGGETTAEISSKDRQESSGIKKKEYTQKEVFEGKKKHFYYFADWLLARRETLSLAACVLQRSKTLRGSRTQQGEILFQFNINSIAI